MVDINTAKRAVGEKLRILRQEKGTTSTQLAKLLGCTQSTISKFENGKLKPSPEFVAHYAEALGLSKNEKEHLLTLTDYYLIEFDKWYAEKTGRLANAQRMIKNREYCADEIRDFQWILICGLLQTRAYAFSIFRLVGEKSPQEINHAVKARIYRQKEVFLKNKRLHIILSEHALRTPIVSKDIMREQIGHLKQLLNRENLILKILPLSQPLPVLVANSFTIYDRKTVAVETRTRGINLWIEPEVESYNDFFRKLDEVSIYGNDVEKLLSKIELEY